MVQWNANSLSTTSVTNIIATALTLRRKKGLKCFWKIKADWREESSRSVTSAIKIKSNRWGVLKNYLACICDKLKMFFERSKFKQQPSKSKTFGFSVMLSYSTRILKKVPISCMALSPSKKAVSFCMGLNAVIAARLWDFQLSKAAYWSLRSPFVLIA